MQEQGQAEPADQQLAEPIRPGPAQGHDPPQDPQVQQDQPGDPDQAELFGVDREDEVGGMFRQEVELGLGALGPAFSGNAAGANRDLGLDHVVAAAERVGLRVEEDSDSIFLVFAQRVLPHEWQADPRQCPHAENPPPRNPGQQDDRDPNCGHQQRRAQVRLDGDQPSRQRHQPQSQDDAEGRQGRQGRAQEVGHHHGGGEFEQFGRLEGDRAVRQPALGSAAAAVEHDRQQQEQVEQEQGRSPSSESLRGHVRHGQQRKQADANADGMLLGGVRAHVVGTVLNRQAERQDRQQQSHQGSIQRFQQFGQGRSVEVLCHL